MSKILITDDSATMRKIIMRVLRQAGFQIEEIVEAANGVEGLRKLEETPGVSIVLSDMNMPEMGGVDFVKALRAKHGADLPIVMISTEGGESTIQEALAVGADAYVTKPFTPDSIREALGRYLG
jgi:two-component system chemotaxis response regulator CheY